MKHRLLALCLLLAVPAVAPGDPPALNLATALRLAGAKNLAIELARERVLEARSQLDQDRLQLFPWIAPGVGYRRHDGNLQDVAGNIFDASKQSGSAGVVLQAQWDLGDSLYRVLASRQAVAVSEAGADARRRDTLRDVAVAYTELSRAAASRVTAEEVRQLAVTTLRQVRGAVDAGLAFAGDAQRVEVQVGLSESLVLEAHQALRVASARLAQLLRLPPAEELHPDLAEFVPVGLVATNQSLTALVAAALAQRPEVRRADASVGVAQARRDGAARGVWLPTVGAQATVGGLAGGRNGSWRNGDDFQEYGVGVFWRIGPGGIGDRTRIRTADARRRVAELERDQLRDEVARQVVELQTRTQVAADRLRVADHTLAAARRLVDLTHARREFGVGIVLEAIDAEREFSRAQADHLQAIADHNRLQWEFWHASGLDESSLRPDAGR